MSTPRKTRTAIRFGRTEQSDTPFKWSVDAMSRTSLERRSLDKEKEIEAFFYELSSFREALCAEDLGCSVQRYGAKDEGFIFDITLAASSLAKIKESLEANIKTLNDGSLPNFNIYNTTSNGVLMRITFGTLNQVTRLTEQLNQYNSPEAVEARTALEAKQNADADALAEEQLGRSMQRLAIRPLSPKRTFDPYDISDDEAEEEEKKDGTSMDLSHHDNSVDPKNQQEQKQDAQQEDEQDGERKEEEDELFNRPPVGFRRREEEDGLFNRPPAGFNRRGGAAHRLNQRNNEEEPEQQQH